MASEDKSKEAAKNAWGAVAESIAADYIASQGYIIRERNWKIPRIVEIDIIAQKGTEIVFVEVKARSGEWDEPEAAIDEKKIHKMVTGADIYLRSQEHRFDYRFDIIAITGNRKKHTIRHYADAFISPVSKIKR